MKLFSLCALIVLSLTSHAQDLQPLSEHPRWLRLLHYKGKLFGQGSLIDNDSFFFAPDGATSPKQELEATIKAFQSLEYDAKKYRWHPQCAYPARVKFIKENTQIQLPQVECKDFDWWRNRLNAKSISLVFSSYYKGNPASMFGHTLLKFNTTDGLDGGTISDFTFSFAANVGEDQGLTYIIKGLTGGFPGTFSTEPYYVKVNDYVQGESRDIWEYLLDFNADEVDWIVRHAWELKMNALFDYYFLDENCSYILLEVLDVAKPKWRMSRGFYFYTLPVSTIKRLDEHQGVKKVFYRPSFRKKMMERLRRLNDEEKQQYYAILDNKENLDKSDNTRVVEAYIAYLRYKQYEQTEENTQVKQIKTDLRKTLIKRARMGGVAESVEETIRQRNMFDDPRNSHETYTTHLQYGKHSLNDQFVEFGFRFGVHDLMNNELGLPLYSNIDILSFRPRYYKESRKLRLQEVIVVDLLTLIDYDSITRDLSWGVQVKGELPRDFESSTLAWQVKPTVGLSYYLFNKKMNLYSLVFADMQVGSFRQEQRFRLGPGLELGMVSYLTGKTKLQLGGKAIYDFMGKLDKKQRYSYRAQLGYSFGKHWEMKIGHEFFSSSEKNRKATNESGITGIYFF